MEQVIMISTRAYPFLVTCALIVVCWAAIYLYFAHHSGLSWIYDRLLYPAMSTVMHASASAMASTNSAAEQFFGASLGTGLIEIAALTALIGSATAEQLALGNRGAAGLAWVGMSTFGSVSILKACTAAATPHSLRETLGVRNATTDAATGLSLNLESTYMSREDMARKNLGEAVGVICEGKKQSGGRHLYKRKTADDICLRLSKRDVYAFDQYTTNLLNCVAPFPPGSEKRPPLYIYLRDPHYTGPTTKNDWIGLALTLGKVVELYVLYVVGAGSLSWVSGLNWFYFFTAAVILQLSQLSRGYRKDFDSDGRLDIIAGGLPIARKPASACRIVLGLPGNFRHHVFWKVVWALGAAVCATSLVASYVALTSCAPRAVYTWVGCQLFWVFCRSGFFHVADSASKIVCPVHQSQNWETLSPGLKDRVLELLLTLCKYQTHVHPRSSYSYLEDVMELGVIRDLVARYLLVDEYPLDLHRTLGGVKSPIMIGSIELTFRAVLGDTFISSASWFNGFKYTPMDLYDCCIAFLEIPVPSSGQRVGTAATQLCAIPAVRPISAAENMVAISPDVEAGRKGLECDQQEIRLTSPKGSPNSAHVEWYYWIPCTGGLWIQVHSSNLKILGKRTGQVMTSQELTRSLRSGERNISLENADMVKDVVDVSRTVAAKAVDLFKSMQPEPGKAGQRTVV